MTRPASTRFDGIIGPTVPTVTGHPIRCTTLRIRPRSATKPVAVAYTDAARRWLTEWAADEFGIGESFSTLEVTIAARLEDLLRALAWNAEPQLWATRPTAAVRATVAHRGWRRR